MDKRRLFDVLAGVASGAIAGWLWPTSPGLAGAFAAVVMVAAAVVLSRRMQTRLAALAEDIATLRALSLVEIEHRPAAPGTIADADRAAFDAAERDFARLGFASLGDWVQDGNAPAGAQPSSASERVVRWFTDRAGSIGWFGIATAQRVARRVPVTILISARSDDGYTLTTRGAPDRGVALPPDVRVRRCPPSADLESVVAAHRDELQRHPGPPLRVAADWRAASAIFRDLRRRVAEWRRAQPEDDLFEADLRSILKRQHAWCAEPMRRRLRSSAR